MDYQIEINQKHQSLLDSAKAEFFRRGGKVEVIKTPITYVPPPPRKEPKLTADEKLNRELSVKIREMAPTMSKTEIQRALGITYERVLKICEKHSIRPISGAGNHPNSRSAPKGSRAAKGAETEISLVDRIKGMALSGLSKTMTQKKVCIGQERMNNLVEKYGIVFIVRKN